ncbi:uncharacterized protein LOC116666421 isoform X2 [Camelus ferus]|uniref:Uncharacterized protein LOC116666421 isoform X2 n=1 Tax=Camelus ferus TaxID=419612 RepID=A0A8B8TSC0_CAMFR|nr:uncharacterized protein LOC116666421 isoform X2 [Camelus ferus]
MIFSSWEPRAWAAPLRQPPEGPRRGSARSTWCRTDRQAYREYNILMGRRPCLVQSLMDPEGRGKCLVYSRRRCSQRFLLPPPSFPGVLLFLLCHLRSVLRHLELIFCLRTFALPGILAPYLHMLDGGGSEPVSSACENDNALVDTKGAL